MFVSTPFQMSLFLLFCALTLSVLARTGRPMQIPFVVSLFALLVPVNEEAQAFANGELFWLRLGICLLSLVLIFGLSVLPGWSRMMDSSVHSERRQTKKLWLAISEVFSSLGYASAVMPMLLVHLLPSFAAAWQRGIDIMILLGFAVYFLITLVHSRSLPILPRGNQH